MAGRFVELHDAQELVREFERSHERPVVLYLHDPLCGINAQARREVARADVRAAWIDVAVRHGLGMEVEQRTGIRHESPQVLLLRDGRAVWAASHGRITAEAIRSALAGVDELAARSEPKVERGSILEGLRRGAARLFGQAGAGGDA